MLYFPFRVRQCQLLFAPRPAPLYFGMKLVAIHGTRQSNRARDTSDAGQKPLLACCDFQWSLVNITINHAAGAVIEHRIIIIDLEAGFPGLVELVFARLLDGAEPFSVFRREQDQNPILTPADTEEKNPRSRLAVGADAMRERLRPLA